MIYSPTMISGSGKPRLMLELLTVIATYTDTLFSGTTITFGAGKDLSALSVGMRARSSTDTLPAGEPTWGKIVSFNDTTDTILVDSWSNGTPKNGESLVIDGWVVDLPRAQRLQERFTPEYLTHELYGGDRGARLKTRFRGWRYECRLDYGDYTSGEMLYNLRRVMGAGVRDKIILVPRADAPGFAYYVIFDGAIDLERFGLSLGYRGPVFHFRAVENLPDWPILDGYGYNYGNDYGVGL